MQPVGREKAALSFFQEFDDPALRLLRCQQHGTAFQLRFVAVGSACRGDIDAALVRSQGGRRKFR